MQKLCRALLFIGFSVQMVLGICWMIMNFPHMQMFGESALYVEISKNLICDEYEGILYPVLILLARGIEEIFPIPYHCFLYLFQLSIAFCAGYKCLQCFRIAKRMQLVWGSLALLTFPLAMQCHLAVLPDSLVASFLLLELAYGLDVVLDGKPLFAVNYVKVLACWLVTALLRSEFFYLGMIPVVILFVYGMVKAWKQHKKTILYHMILWMSFLGMILGVQSLTQMDGYYGRTHQSLNAMLASRCVWSYVHVDYDYWPEDVRAQITKEEVLPLENYADNMERILGRKLEETLGVERTEEVFGFIAKHAWTYHKGTILHGAAWDAVGYTFSPPVIQRQFEGKAYDSYTGRNYDIMRMNTPRLTACYLNYSCWWFVVGFALTAVAQVVVLLKKKRSFWTVGKVVALLGWVCTVSGMVFYYTIRGAAMMDYKKTIAVILLWLLWMLVTNRKESGKGEQTC